MTTPSNRTSALDGEVPPPQPGKDLQNIELLIKPVYRESIRTFATKRHDRWLEVTR